MKKIFSILALALVAMTASAYNLTVGTNEHGTVTFKVGNNTVTTANENDVVTVEITPDANWSTGTIQGQWYAAVANAPRHAQDIDLLKDFVLTPVEGNENAYTFTMKRANAEISVSYKKQLTHEDISIANIDDQTYTGSAIEPTVTVKDGNTTLVKDEDYTVEYSNNTDAAASDDENAPTVTVTGKGEKYSGTASKKFTILKADLWNASIELDEDNFEYDGDEKTPTVTMTYNGNELTEGIDYSVRYDDNVNAGWATVNVMGMGNFEGYNWTTFTINPKIIEDGDVTIEDGGTDNLKLTIHENGSQQGGIVPAELEVSTLDYERSLPASAVNAYTVCLPYAPSTEGGLKYYTLTGVEGTTLHFTEISGAPLAYTPYLVFASSSTDIGKTNVTNVTMSKEVDGSTAGSYELKGTLSGISHNDAQGFYILQSGNRWAKIGSDTHAYIPPFRAYIVSAAAASAPAVDYLDNEFHDAGSATGIDSMRTTDRNGTERWFDLNGRRIEKPTTKGIYIHNGRKEIAK